MADTKILEDKIKNLQDKIRILEEKLAFVPDKEELDLMEAFYQKAKLLTQNNNHISAIFLQKKLLIDFPRAKKILEKLKADGLAA